MGYGCERKVQPRRAKSDRNQPRRPPGVGCHVSLVSMVSSTKPMRCWARENQEHRADLQYQAQANRSSIISRNPIHPVNAPQEHQKAKADKPHK